MKYIIRYTVIILSVFMVGVLQAQTIERKVINTMGGTLAPGGGPQITHNLGETFSTTLAAGGYSLTQGFLQYSLVSVPPISGTLTVCVGATTTLTNSMTGGTWSSSNTSVATVGSTGLVTGVTAGSSTISYTVGGSSAMAVVTVNTSPSAGSIIGTTTLYNGDTIFLASSVSGGTWTSSNPSIATVNSSGRLVGVSPGSVLVSYTLSNSCGSVTNTKYVLVMPGEGYHCTPSWKRVGDIGDSINGPLWTDVVIDKFGFPYVVFISMSYPGGPSIPRTTVFKYSESGWQIIGDGDEFPSNGIKTNLVIDDSGRVYVAFSDIDYGGRLTIKRYNGTGWDYVGPRGFSYGTANNSQIVIDNDSMPVVAFNDGAFAYRTSVMKFDGVNWDTLAILGEATASMPSIVASDSGVYVANSWYGGFFLKRYYSGSWSDISSGIFDTGSISEPIIRVNQNSDVYVAYLNSAHGNRLFVKRKVGSSWPIVGSQVVSDSDAYFFDFEISRDGTPFVAYRDMSDPHWYYSGCTMRKFDGEKWKIIGKKGFIGDPFEGLSIAVDSINTPYIACPEMILLDSVSVEAGTKANVYRFNSDSLSDLASVNSVCIGDTVDVLNTGIGGVWTTSDTLIARISSSGKLVGLTSGTAYVSYQIGSCYTVKLVSVNSTPSAGSITGPSTVSTCSAISLSNTTSGGSWSSSNPAKATVGSTGVVTGVTAGTVTISYTVTNSCGTATATKILTVNTVSGGIPTSGLVAWYPFNGNANDESGNGNNGVVNGATLTTDHFGVGGKAYYFNGVNNYISTALGFSAGSSEKSFSVWYKVNPVSRGWIIGGGIDVNGQAFGLFMQDSVGTVLFHGMSVYDRVIGTYSDTIWHHVVVCYKSDTLKAYVDGNNVLTTNNVLNTNSSNIYFGRRPNPGIEGGVDGYYNGKIDDIAIYNRALTPTEITQLYNAGNVAGTITGSSTVCTGSTITLTDTTSGGSWSSSNTSVATVGSTGIVTGIAAGTATISYTVTNTCGSGVATKIITVNSTPTAGTITGSSSVCAGSTITLSNATSGGSWSSSNTYKATVGSTGVVTGVAAGTVTISYTVTNSCGTVIATKVLTVNAAISLPVEHWTVMTPMPTPRQALSGAVIDSIIYVIGGTITPGNSSIVEAYNVNTNAWVTKSPMPTPRAELGVAVVNGKIYAIGGYNTGTVTSVEKYDPITDTWTTLAPMPTSRSALSVAAIGNNIYAIGGFPSGMATLEVYNTVTNSWSTKSPLPSGRKQINSLLAINGKLYLVGGKNDPTIFSDNYVYDTLSNTWSVVTSLPYAQWAGAGCVLNNKICYFGGSTNIGWAGGTRNNNSFDPATNNWQSHLPMLQRCASMYAATVNDKIYLIGGTDSLGNYVNWNYQFSIVDSAIIAAITGPSSVYVGSTITLTDTTAGGTWSSSNTSIATVGSTGVVTGVTPGTVTISYTVSNACGSAVATKVVTVNSAMSSPITGTLTTCIGATTTLSNTATGGTWASSTPAVAIIGSASGIVTGVSAGTSTITYTLGGSYVTAVVTVYAMPAAITGSGSACVGATITLACTTTGGSWSSSNTAAATVGSTGIIAGVATGTTVISYTMSGTCSSTKTITINASPTAIGGTLNGCIGMTNTFTCTPTGGAWSSSTPSVANINAMGQATGYAAGTTTITYGLSSGCKSTAVLTINALPDSVSGTAVVCAGLTTALTGYPSGGNWSSSTTTKATVDASGVVTGVALGTSRITYTNAGGCYKTKVVTVNAAPLAITGTAAVCVANTTTLACPGGGTWSSSNTSVATIGSTGVVTGVAAGTATITYRLSTGCINTRVVTVNNAPAAITGTANICVGTTTALSSTTTGGTWSSSGLTVGTVGSTTGVVTGISGGAVTITYTIAGGCRATRAVTVNNNPPSIGGTATLATGGTTTLTNSMTGGTWSSGNTGVATVVSTGLVSGISSGTARISYTSAAGCSATKVVTVSGAIGAITGTTTLCTGTTSLLSCTPTGGAWSSSNSAVATVTSGGLVTGVSAGTATIIYTISGTSVTTVVTVYTMPAAITGSGLACTGANTTLACTTTGGTWSSSNTATATVGSTGIVTGIAAGTVTISYSMGGSCVSTKAMTVNTTPGAVTGTMSTCVGTSATLSGTPTGGGWSSSNPSVANIDATGQYAGYTAGTATMTYAMGTGCYSTAEVTINAVPASITGTMSICEGTNTTLSTTTTGGSWSSSNTAVATVGSTGIVNGIAAGNATITYTQGGCSTTANLTVQAIPSAISGTLTICTGTTSNLSNTSTGGTWVSDNTAVATIGSTSGTVTGVVAGTATITYSVYTGCTTTAIVTVNGVPDAITGTPTACEGGTTTLSCTPTGGVWTTTTPSVATIGSASGIVTGVNAGTAIVTYSAGTGCYSTTTITINAAPGTPAGTATVCEGATTTLTSTITGGTWSSSNTATATVNSSGVVSGIAAGTADITYTVASGCQSVRTVTVNAQPAAVTGAGTICTGATLTVSCVTTGGTWISGAPSVANVGSSTGIVTGVTAGTANISYTVGGCSSSATVTVNQTPASITGTANVCPGTTTTLSTTTTGGSWSSANTATATVGSTGIVTGVAAGTVTISYTLNGCSSVKTVTVNALPGAIGGGPTLCSGITTTLTAIPSGGTWSSSTTTVGTVASTTGVFTGITGGTTTVTYKLATGCQSTQVLTINPTPAAITGASTICMGMTIPLSSATTGGTWSSSNTSVATVNSSGVVSSVAMGTATISYTTGSCSATKLVTVNTVFVSDTTYNMCLGNTKTLIDAVPGGTWASSTPSIATVVAATGVATSYAVGMTTITYSFGAGCSKTTKLYVQNTSATISGPSAVCEGSSASMSVASAYSGGAWSSSNTGVASINMSTGVVTGVSTGTTVITYTLIDCYTTKVVTVNPRPATITGMPFACIGTSTTLSSATTGGSWTSSAVTKATVGSGTGLVTGVAAGTSVISYTLSTGCSRTAVVTVSSAPASITGTTNVCVGNTITLASTSAGGTWNSSDASVANVDASGVVSGVTPGVTTISYGFGGSCTATKTITVNPTPGSSSGPDVVCAGLTITLTNALTGGTWSSSSATTATANSSTGLITGVNAGVVNITYSAPGSCITVKQVTVNAAMPAITGGTSVCVGATVTLSTTATGGTWSSSATAKATIDGTTGVVTGVATGSATITYMVSTGCYKTSAMVVNPVPAAISGASTVVVGSSTTLTCATTGGAWSSSNTAVGTVTSASGSVTGISAGTMTISYTITTTGCRSTKAMTVNPAPLAKGVGATENGGGVKFAVYPNPTQGTLTVETSVAGTFRLFTIDSKLLGTYRIDTPSSTIQLPADLASGVYMCQFNKEDGTTETVRLIYQQ